MKMERPPDVDLNLHLVSRNTNITVLQQGICCIIPASVDQGKGVPP